MWQAGDGKSAWIEDAIRAATEALARTARLNPSEAERVRRLVHRVERYPAGSLINTVTAQPAAKWVIAGWLCQMRILPDARRQIFAVLLPGDAIAARPVGARRAASLLALTRADCADVGEMLQAANGPADRELLRRAMAAALARADERKYDHVVRLGQHTAAERVINLLLELRDRLGPLGLVNKDSFRLPLTQEHLADTLGLSLVHVHRTLKALRAQGLVDVRMGRVTLVRPDRLEQISTGGLVNG